MRLGMYWDLETKVLDRGCSEGASSGLYDWASLLLVCWSPDVLKMLSSPCFCEIKTKSAESFRLVGKRIDRSPKSQMSSICSWLRMMLPCMRWMLKSMFLSSSWRISTFRSVSCCLFSYSLGSRSSSFSRVASLSRCEIESRTEAFGDSKAVVEGWHSSTATSGVQ